MHAGNDHDCLGIESVVETVRESVQSDPPDVSIENGIGLRVVFNLIEGTADS